MGCFACSDAVDATGGQEKEFDAANSLFSIKWSFLRFLLACLHWRERSMEIGRMEVVLVCRKEFMGSKVVVMLGCIFISTTFQCNLLPINWQDPYRAIFSFQRPKGNI